MRVTLLDRPPERRARREQLLLPDELIQCARAHPRGQWRPIGRGLPGGLAADAVIEQLLHILSMASARAVFVGPPVCPARSDAQSRQHPVVQQPVGGHAVAPIRALDAVQVGHPAAGLAHDDQNRGQVP